MQFSFLNRKLNVSASKCILHEDKFPKKDYKNLLWKMKATNKLAIIIGYKNEAMNKDVGGFFSVVAPEVTDDVVPTWRLLFI